MSVTIKDLATYVGKSITTVSRALADYDDVSPVTKQLVRQAVEELGYEPNTIARQLQKKRTDTIALLLPSEPARFSDPFFGELLAGIVDKAAERAVDLLVASHYSEESERQNYLKYIRSRRVDGFILIRTRRKDQRIELLRKHATPFVAFGRVEGDNDFHLIDEDGESGIRQIVDHLVSLGHRRLAYISEPSYLTKAWYRLQGFRSGMSAHQLTIEPALLCEGGFRQRSGRLLTEKLLNLEHPPTAIVTGNDLLALGAISAAQGRGLMVGQDISITGFDDIVLAEYAQPPLTTVHQPAHEIGTQLCKMLLDLIDGREIANPQVILQPSIVIRQSSGSAPLGTGTSH